MHGVLDISFGPIFSLAGLAGIIVGIALGSHPEGSNVRKVGAVMMLIGLVITTIG